jgi:mannose-6-phosphate isomerase
VTELYPLTFQPIPKERVWGGRKLETLYGKSLAPGVPVGETWEIVDRDGDSSVIANGSLEGKDLHWLMSHHGRDLLGDAFTPGLSAFPLLVKILDAREKLSLQVHPPAKIAAALGGEPKTEMWYVAQAEPEAEIYAGLKRGVTRAEFEEKLAAGSVEECFHRLAVKAGDALFLPSGRVHALGAGLVIFEIQQNSDTTYRVFDWNRVGLDGKPRQLHIPQSLQSIDFDDFEPSLAPAGRPGSGPITRRELVKDPLFGVEAWRSRERQTVPLTSAELQIVGLVEGEANLVSEGGELRLAKGQFCMIPASLRKATLEMQPETTVLVVNL